MHSHEPPWGVQAIFLLCIALLIIMPLFLVGLLVGFGMPIQEASHTGYVTDVSHETGLFFKTTQATLKTHPTADEGEQFCVRDRHHGDLLAELRDAHANGERVTVSYSRPLFVGFYDCRPNADPIDAVATVGDGL